MGKLRLSCNAVLDSARRSHRFPGTSWFLGRRFLLVGRLTWSGRAEYGYAYIYTALMV